MSTVIDDHDYSFSQVDVPHLQAFNNFKLKGCDYVLERDTIVK